jgi:sporulation protein YlmC with PRC-barrel domain
MGLLTPLIMGVLGREQRAAGLDAGGLARMLTGQKAEIAAAMPAGLSKLLETNKPLSEGIASPSSTERRTSEGPSTAYTPAAIQRSRGDTPRSNARWAYWVLPLLALAGLLWYLFAREPETVGPVATSKSPSETIRDVQTKIAYLSSVPDSWVSIGHAPNDYVNKDIYNRAGEQLGTIKDVLVGPDGKMTAAIINVGRYLGIGDKEIAVPFSAIQQQRSDSGQRIVIDATKDNLQAAPIFVTHPSSKQ